MYSNMKSKLMKSSGPIAAVALCGAVILGLGASPAVAQQVQTEAAQRAEITVSTGKSQVVELPAPYADVMIANPKIADILPLTNRSVYVVGKEIGSTALTIYGPGKHLLAAVDVTVAPDIDGLKARLKETVPGEKNIAVRTANQSIVVSGTVSSSSALSRVLALSESYAPGKVINMLGVEGVQQVMLSVRFVEMERSLAKDLQLNVQSRIGSNGKSPFQITTGDTINGHTNLLSNLFGQASARLSRGAGALDLFIDALETKGLVKTLAEPNLVAMSGDTANFLAGGEFPIPVQQSSANGTSGTAPTITVEFKQFGVALAFTPTILSDGLINLVVNPEVSEIDPSNSFNIGQIKVPGIKVRRAHTTVEIHDGESFTIAGLLKDTYTNQIRQYPFVGDLPVLGAMFRSAGYQRDETELVIVVTAHLVTPHRGPVATPADHFVPASDLELFLLGSQQASAAGLKPEDRVLLTAEPGKGGVDGPHGHILF